MNVRTVIQLADMPSANPTYSQAIQAAGFVFVSGRSESTRRPAAWWMKILPYKRDKRWTIPRRFSNPPALRWSRLCRANLYLTEFDELSRVNQVYGQYFPKNGPAKTSCGVTGLYGGAKFEIQVIALIA